MNKFTGIVFLIIFGSIGILSLFYFGVKSQDENAFDTDYSYLSNEIIFENNKLILNKFKWSGSLNKKGGGKKYQEINAIPKELEHFEVDIINCGGYLATGKATYIGDFDWEVELNINSVATDIEEKLKQCGTTLSNNRIQDFVVAVTPINKNREFLKTPEISTREMFARLPSEVQWEANCKRGEKDVLSKNQGDVWMDTDGDGEIDYILVSVTCSKTKVCKEDYTCTKTLKLIKGEWTEMSFSTPA